MMAMDQRDPARCALGFERPKLGEVRVFGAMECQSNAMPSASPTLDPVRTWLAALLRGTEPGVAPAESVLLDIARAEGVLALCHDRLRRSAAWDRHPATLRAALARHAYQEVAVEMARAAELREVLDALARHSLSVLLLKGASLAYILYPEPHLRNRCDTDLLLPSRDDAERAWRLLQTLGYQQSMDVPGDLIGYELGCYKKTRGGLIHALDVHWRPSNATLFAERFTFAELAAAAVLVPALGPHARGLGPTHALLLACMHRITNMPRGTADRLIWLYDIHLLAQRITDEGWQQVTALAEERALCGPCLDGLGGAQMLFATALPDEVQHRLRVGADRDGFDPRQIRPRWRYEWLNFRALPSTTARLRWLGQHLFPDTGFMRRHHGVRGPLGLPWFYAVRIVRGVAKWLHRS